MSVSKTLERHDARDAARENAHATLRYTHAGMGRPWGANARTASVVVLTALALVTAGAPAIASADEPDLETIGQLNTQAQERFANKQYVEAADAWIQVYEKLPSSAAWQYQRALVSQQIFTAYREEFNETREIAHLRRARTYLLRYISLIDPKVDAEAHAQAEQDLAVLDAQLEGYDQVVEAGNAELRAQRLREEERDEFEDDAPPRTGLVDGTEPSGRGLLIAGGVTAGLGVVLLSVMAVGIAQGIDATTQGEDFISSGGDPADPVVGDLLDRGRRADTLAYAAGIAGGLSAATGVVLLGVGSSRARRGAATTFSLHPGVGRVSLTIRF